ncbi:carboxypeptidase-like regulatory domain-containing protein [Alkalimonas sp. MEB108]|uniref:Carboxypeptidase-like regulatory domain-containing protein n=1 Tax=Alkalimonas cellulosilytica TaxID=3058395 RepID=A0ABU7J8F3_9GAMM|nr:carboxypeptidase-like regulatory domain-containing protein [Alkalimonas sp. MEB108]MEE2002287.1 carboxypeptidase-like regulatory domain-containing protein [Alkalimonas sp. MEB108]
MLEWQRIDKKPAIAGLALILLMFTTHVEAGVFGWFKKTELELSPEVNGTVTLHNKPVAGATVHRYLTYSDKKFNDSAITDEQGHFQLPVKIAKLRVSPMFDTTVTQTLVVEHANSRTEIWAAANLNTLNYDSIRQLLSSMQCELTSPDMRLEIPMRNPQSPPLGVVSICTFEHDEIILEKELWK